MKAISIGDILDLLKAWQASLPKRRFLVAAVILVALGAWVRSMGGFEKVQGLCDQVIADLSLIQPFSLWEAYFRNLAACDRTSLSSGEVMINCSPFRFIHPARLVGSLLTTLWEIWSRSDILGRIFLPLAMIGAFPVAISIIFSLSKRLFDSDEINLFHVCFAAPLIPFVTSVFALVLQVLAIALFFVFGKVVGLMVWLVSIIATPLAIWKFAKSTVNVAKKLETISETVAPVSGGNSTDREKPK